MKKIILLSVLLVAAAVFILELVYLPASLDRLLTDSLLVNSFPLVKPALSYENYALLHLALRCLANALFWVAAVFVFLQTRKQEPAIARMGLLTSALLICLPIQVLWASIVWSLILPDSWERILAIAYSVFSLVGLMLLMFFYYLFPTGRFKPAWLAWPVRIFALLLLGVFSLMVNSEAASERLWSLGFLAYFVGVVVGLISQWLRLRRPAVKPVISDEAQAQITQPRAQPAWLTIAISALPLAIIGSSLLNGSPWQYLLSSFLQLVLVAILPAAILAAIFRQELWPLPAAAGHDRMLANPRRSAAIVLVSIAAIGLLTFLPASRRTPLSAEKQRKFDQFYTSSSLPFVPSPRPVVIDTDMAYDDWIALLYVLQRPELSVKAITVNGTGESHCEPGVRNALALIKLAGEANIPVACGREIPLQGEHVFPEEWRQSSDRLNDLVIPDGENTAQQTDPATHLDAAALLRQVIQTSPEKVTLLTLGALTNIGEAIQQDPTFLENISQVYIMGGALEVLGNVQYGSGIDNKVAEWNIYIDPLSLKILLDSGAPVTFVPLDATNQVPANMDFYHLLGSKRTTPEARFVNDLMNSELDVIASGINSFWDPLTAAILADESLATIREGKLKIYTEEGPSSGLTRLMNDGTPVRYAKTVNPWRFYADLIRTLNQP